jgi:hypothetical protein
MSDPTRILLQGTRILETELRPLGFEFIFRAAGKGSGGPFATGDFIRDDRRLELQFRESLGLNHIGTSSAAHPAYMRERGVRDEWRYPGFSDDPLVAFHDLADDLKFSAGISPPAMQPFSFVPLCQKLKSVRLDGLRSLS